MVCLKVDKIWFKYADLNYAGVNKTDKMATIVINLSGAQVLIHEEKMLYPFPQLLSDVGGAAGLILGLNVLVLVQFCGKWFGFLVNNICFRQLNFVIFFALADKTFVHKHLKS